MSQVTLRLEKQNMLTFFSRSSSTKTQINTEITNRFMLEISRGIDDAHRHCLYNRVVVKKSIVSYEIDDNGFVQLNYRENRSNGYGVHSNRIHLSPPSHVI